MKKINLETINLSGISGGGTPSGGGASDASLAALQQNIEQMEYVTATAIADLYAKIENINGQIDDLDTRVGEAITALSEI